MTTRPGSTPTRRRRLRRRLLLPALIVACVLTGLAFVRAAQLRRAQEALVKANALATAVSSSRAFDETIAETQALLVSVSELIDLATPPARADSILQRIRASAPVPYLHLVVVARDGRVIGTAQPLAIGRDGRELLRQPLYARIMESRSFSVGILQRARLQPGQPLMLPFAMPVFDAERREVVGFVGASVLVDSLEPVRRARRLPEGSVLTIMDSSGTIIYRTLDPDHWIGRSFQGDTGVATDFRIRERVGSGLRSADGTVRLVGTRRIERVPWVLYLGIPLRHTLDIARNEFLRDLALGAALTIVLLAVGYRSTLSVAAPIESLTSDTQAIAAGDMMRRSTVDSDDEVGDLARAFNRMADTIVQRNAELKSSQDQLLHAQKMDAIGSFAGGIAHDFNNYLHSIIGHTELATIGLPPDAPAREDLREVLSAASRAADLTRQILVFSRKQVVEPRLLDLNSVVRGIERMLVRMIGENRQLELQLADRVLTVLVDQGQLEQVIVNLVVNARDATCDGGVITLATRAVTGTGAARTEATAHLLVRDNGTGMPPEVRERVFDPFFTTKERRGGTGLGLAIAYGIMEQASGGIAIDSTMGAGTTVTIALPLRSGEVITPVTSPVVTGFLQGRGRILLAEDNAAVRRSTERMLLNAGYEVVSAADGPSAMHQLRSEAGEFDVLVSDVMMPGMSGSELAALVRAAQPGIGVLFISGYADDDALQAELASSATICVAKPFTAATLIAALNNVMKSRELETARPA
ncbi:MAG: response regulator [Gemmatimonadaceae bacterium]|nr:response regulator [Gemmatimonadaceae bacterium]